MNPLLINDTESELVTTLVMTLTCPTCSAAEVEASEAVVGACLLTLKFFPSYLAPKRVVLVEVEALAAASLVAAVVDTHMLTAGAGHEASQAVSAEHQAVSTLVDKGTRTTMTTTMAHRPTLKTATGHRSRDVALGMMAMKKTTKTADTARTRRRGGARRLRPPRRTVTGGCNNSARSAWSSLPLSSSSPRRPWYRWCWCSAQRTC